MPVVYVPRPFGSTLILTENATANKDVSVRGRVQAGSNRDITVRGNVSSQVSKDVTLRGRLLSSASHDVTLRGNITYQKGLIFVPRVFGSTLFLNGAPAVQKDIRVRGRLQAQVSHDITLRGNVSIAVSHDLTLRGRLLAQAYKDLTVRGNVGIVVFKDLALRARLQAQVFKDVSLRGRIPGVSQRDLTVRGRTAAPAFKDVMLRARLVTTSAHDVTLRGNISTRITSGGLTLFANGTGTASFDHFRVTAYPDPALSCSQVLPRAGSTLVAWQANEPTNTDVDIALSTDGVNWTDVSEQNGGAIPSIFSTPAPTVDSFSTYTGANYTHVHHAGPPTYIPRIFGGTLLPGLADATWNWDTTNSRLIATGGTNAMLVNSSVSSTNIEVIADLDMADDGGIVFNLIDQNNFYALSIHDAQSNTGTPNQLILTKVANNIATTLASASISFYRGIPYRFRVTMLSGVITAYMDSVQLLTYTDGSPLGAGQAGVRNNAGTSRYYSLWITPQGDVVTGTPAGDMVTGKFVYTKATLTSTDPTQTPQLLDLETFVGSPAIGTGTLIPNVKYQYTFVGKNLDDLAKQSNYSWYFTPGGSLVFNGRQAQPAPWILSSNTLALPSDIEMDTNLVVEVSGDLYRNRQILTNVLDTSLFQNTFNGDGSSASFTLSYPVASGTIPSITLNGLVQTIGVKGTSGSQWYYAAGDAVIAQDSSGTKLVSTDSLIISYTGIFTTEVVVDNTDAQIALAALEGGSGIIEAVEDVSQQVMFYDAAVTYANQLLDRYCITGRSVTFATYRNGLAAGMLLAVFVPEEGILDGQFLITQIDIQMKTQPNNTVLYQYIVQCTELANKKGWARLLSATLD